MKPGINIFVIVYFIALCKQPSEASILDEIKDKINLTSVIPDYNYNETEVETKWILRPYASIGESSIRNLRKDPPYEFINEVVKSFRGDSTANMATVKEKFVEYSVPYLILAGVTFASALFVMIYGLGFCCATCLNKCCTVPKHDDEHQLGNKTRFIHPALICVALVFIIVAGSAIVTSSRRINAGVGLAKTLTHNSLRNLLHFQTKTLEGVENLLITQLDKTVDSVLDNLGKVAKESTNLIKGATSKSEPLVSKLQALDGSLNDISNNISSALTELRESQVKFRSDFAQFENQIEELKSNLTAAFSYCQSNATLNNTGICQAVALQSDVQLTLNSTTLRNASSGFISVFSLLSASNLTQQSLQFNASVTEFMDEAVNISEFSTADREKFIKKIKDERNKVFTQIEDILRHKVNEYILSKDDEIMAMFDEKGVIGRTENSVSTALIVLGSVILVSIAIVLVDLMFGLPVLFLGNAIKYREGSKLPNIAVKTSLCFLHQFFVLGPIYLIAAGCLFVLCACLTQICLGLKDGSILRNMESSEALGGSNAPLQSAISNLPKNVTIASIIDVCGSKEQNATIWNAMKLNKVFDIRKMLKLKEMANPLEFLNLGSVFDVNSYPGMNTAPLKEAITNLTESNNNINESSRLSEPLLRLNWTQFAENVTQLSDSVAATDPSFSAFLGGIGSAAGNIIKKAAGGASNAKDTVSKAADGVIGKTKDAINKVKDIVKSADSFGDYLDKMKEAIEEAAKKALGVVDQFITHLEDQLSMNIGKCSFVASAYNRSIEVYCYYFVNALNSIWLSLGLASYTVIVFLYFFIRAIYYYRLARLAVSRNVYGDINYNENLSRSENDFENSRDGNSFYLSN